MMKKFISFFSGLFGVGFLLLSILCWIAVDPSPAYDSRWYIFLAGCILIYLAGKFDPDSSSSKDSIGYEIDNCEEDLRKRIENERLYGSQSHLDFLEKVQREFYRYTEKVELLNKTEGTWKEPLIRICDLITETLREIELGVIREPGEYRYRLITLDVIINRRIKQIESLHTSCGVKQ